MPERCVLSNSSKATLPIDPIHLHAVIHDFCGSRRLRVQQRLG